jgi:hypothetical protein
VENQKRELEAVAKRHGWKVAGVFAGPWHQRGQGEGGRPLTRCSTAWRGKNSTW